MCPADDQSASLKQEAETKLNRREECLQTVWRACSVCIGSTWPHAKLRSCSIERAHHVCMCQAQRLVRCGDFAQAFAQVDNALNAFPQNDPLAKCMQVCAMNLRS